MDSFYKTSGHLECATQVAKFFQQYFSRVLQKQRKFAHTLSNVTVSFTCERMFKESSDYLCILQTPRQSNFVDCGAYTVHFAKVFFSDPSLIEGYIKVSIYLG
jgi:Ulp1 family protease